MPPSIHRSPHAVPSEILLKEMDTEVGKGLPTSRVSGLGEKFGPNELTPPPKPHWWREVFRHFNELVIWILVAAAALSAVLGDWTDSAVIILVVVLNGLLGFFQERKAKEAFSSLEKLSALTAKVIRDGIAIVIPARSLVPGDLIELAEGDLVPADARLISASSLQIQEATLTGESLPVSKDADQVVAEETALADRKNMVYSGTAVTSGRANALVVATGMETELGKIAGSLRKTDSEATPLQKRIQRFGEKLVVTCFGIIGIIFTLQLFRGGSALEVFLLSVSLAVAAVPEGLPVIVTLTLAIGVRRMTKRKVLVRRLPSVETLGSVAVICTDKTGTLTHNEMTARWIYAGGSFFRITGSGYEPRGKFFKANALGEKETEVDDLNQEPDLHRALATAGRCNNARLRGIDDKENKWEVFGDPTDGAFLVAALKGGITVENPQDRVVYELPFDSQRKSMSVCLQTPDSRFELYTKGAIEAILPKCTREYFRNTTEPLSAKRRDQILKVNDDLASAGFRVLAFAHRQSDTATPSATEENLVFAGLGALMDPPRSEVKVAVQRCLTAGIKPVMITGDHPATALSIAKELGIATTGDLVMSGTELQSISSEALRANIKRVSVYARVTADQKRKIVHAWQASGAPIAMTGDGVNDAPAIQDADIGIAMGIKGTEVTKQVSDLILMDDNFSTIVAGVEEGRTILENIKKVLNYLLAGNTGELAVMLGASILNLPMPLLATQILWVNLVTDAFPALALSVEPGEKGVMERPPLSANEPIIPWARALAILSQGLVIGLVALYAFWNSYSQDPNAIGKARTVAFGTLTFAHVLFALSCRSSHPFFRVRFLSNVPLLIALTVSLLLQAMVMLIPHVREWFGVVILTEKEWGQVLVLSVIPVGISEIAKIARAISARLNE